MDWNEKSSPNTYGAANIILNRFFQYFGSASSTPQIMSFFDDRCVFEFDKCISRDKAEIHHFMSVHPPFQYSFGSFDCSDIPNTQLSMITISGYLFYEHQISKKFHSTICISTQNSHVTIKSFILNFLD